MKQRSCRVIGTGSIGSRYLRILANQPHWLTYAVPIGGALRDSELAEPVIVEDLRAKKRPHVDLTVIASRTGRHVQDYLAFSEFSQFVLIEKPIAPNLEMGLQILASNRIDFTAVSAPLRFLEAFEFVKALLPRAGPVRSVRVICESWLPSWRPNSDYRASYSADPSEGGVLRDLVHEIDYTLALFGAPLSVCGVLAHEGQIDIEAETSAELLLAYPNYDIRMTLDFASKQEQRRLAVAGEMAEIEWNLLDGSVAVTDLRTKTSRRMLFPKDRLRDIALIKQIESLVSIDQPRRVCSVSESLRAVAICDLARLSDELSTTIELTGDIWSRT